MLHTVMLGINVRTMRVNEEHLTPWMLFPVWPRRTFSAIIRYLPSWPTRGRFELCSPSWRMYGLAWKRKQP